jgi:beta-glucosidase
MKKFIRQAVYKKGLLFALSLVFAASTWAQQYPFQDPELSSEERARDLISRLTLEEKASLLCDNSDPVPRLGIKQIQLVE